MKANVNILEVSTHKYLPKEYTQLHGFTNAEIVEVEYHETAMSVMYFEIVPERYDEKFKELEGKKGLEIQVNGICGCGIPVEFFRLSVIPSENQDVESCKLIFKLDYMRTKPLF